MLSRILILILIMVDVRTYVLDMWLRAHVQGTLA